GQVGHVARALEEHGSQEEGRVEWPSGQRIEDEIPEGDQHRSQRPGEQTVLEDLRGGRSFLGRALRLLDRVHVSSSASGTRVAPHLPPGSHSSTACQEEGERGREWRNLASGPWPWRACSPPWASRGVRSSGWSS